MTKRTLFTAAALAAAFTFTACKKDKSEDKTDPAAATAPTTDTMAADKPAEGTPPPATTPTTPTATAPATPPARPTSITDEHVKAADEFVNAVAATAAAAEGAKTDCKAMAKALSAQAGAMKALVAKLESMKKTNEKDAAAKEWFKATYEAKVMDGFGKLMTAIEPCKSDAAVIASLKDIGPKKKEEKKVESAPAAPATK